MLHNALEKFWRMEHCGILPQKDTVMSTEDIKALETLERDTKLLEGNRLEAPMLWKNPEVKLPDSHPLALKRFGFLERKLRSDSDLHEKVNAIVTSYLSAVPPYARKMSPEEAKKRGPRTWHLPTFPIIHPRKKVRLVNDAAAEFKGTSLNNELVTGPDLLSSLVGVLMRLRKHAVAIGADVEAMFHQIRVTKEDADSLRFFWKEDINADGPPDTYQMDVHMFGAKCSPTVANYALQKTARDNAHKFGPETLESALKSFYVDDLLKSVRTVDEAITLSKELMSMLKLGGFRLTKFLSNRREVLEALPQSEISASAIMSIDEGDKLEKPVRALGVSWDTKDDAFFFTFSVDETPMTKKGIVSTTNSFYDPMGWLLPFLLIARLLIQELWRRQYGWDEEIDESLAKQWSKWLESAKLLTKIRIPRWYIRSDKPVAEIQLHIFCDASELAYGSVAYLRYTFKEGGNSCALVMSKSRLAPIKTVTLPRLEMCAAQAGARLNHLIVHEIDLPIERVQFWSDSTLVLQYLNNTRHRMKVFVANRVTEILTHSDATQWKHLPGVDNPADLLTRGIANPEKLQTSMWYSCADFLMKEESEWPGSSGEELTELSSEDVEIKKLPVFVATTMLEDAIGINVQRFSNWLRLRRVVGWMIRFGTNTQSVESDRCKDDTLTSKEITAAEEVIVRDLQGCAFQEELKYLRQEKPLPVSNRLSSLCPFVDANGILRVGGRLKRLQITKNKKHPIILPRVHPVTKIVIEWFHRDNGHVGPEHVLSLIREHFWILGARMVINQVCDRCFLCRVRRAQQQFPFMADLPLCRAAINQPPFSHCGVDCWGPVLIKQGRKRLKRWGVIFTCMTIRCVHLEAVESSETDTFINALRRFVNRRGSPLHMYSDNGKNFEGASAELQEFVKKLAANAVKDFASTKAIEWHFNPPKAPHMGGAWERLIRSVKEVMFGLVKNQVLTDPQLQTLLTEVEHIVNSRPLTHLSNDVSDYDALTPNHVLLGMHRNWVAIADTDVDDITSRKQWKQVQALRAIFWSRWVKEYLPTLTKRSCWRDSKPNFKVDELVLLEDDNVKRKKWPLARITEVIESADGVVRQVEVRTKDGIYKRPVSRLYKLEDNDNFEVPQGGEC